MCTAREEMYSIYVALRKTGISVSGVCSSGEGCGFKTAIHRGLVVLCGEATDTSVPLLPAELITTNRKVFPPDLGWVLESAFLCLDNPKGKRNMHRRNRKDLIVMGEDETKASMVDIESEQ
jgi:hypothetical protein